MDNFFRIKNFYESTIEVEKSKFIAVFLNLENIGDFPDILKNLKIKYPKARHYCYAYVCDNALKYSDDGEPSGTAGRPILELLQKKKFNKVAIVVIRYFGGKLLGSGRLLRTYVEASKNAIDQAKKYYEERTLKYSVDIDIEIYDIFTNYLRKNGAEILCENFDENVFLEFILKKDVKEDLNNLFYGKIYNQKIDEYTILKEV